MQHLSIIEEKLPSINEVSEQLIGFISIPSNWTDASLFYGMVRFICTCSYKAEFYPYFNTNAQSWVPIMKMLLGSKFSEHMAFALGNCLVFNTLSRPSLNILRPIVVQILQRYQSGKTARKMMDIARLLSNACVASHCTSGSVSLYYDLLEAIQPGMSLMTTASILLPSFDYTASASDRNLIGLALTLLVSDVLTNPQSPVQNAIIQLLSAVCQKKSIVGAPPLPEVSTAALKYAPLPKYQRQLMELGDYSAHFRTLLNSHSDAIRVYTDNVPGLRDSLANSFRN